MKVGNNQKGFTLIEIMVAMAVGGILLSGLVTAIFLTTGITMRSSTQITALEDIKTVARQLSIDMSSSSNITLADEPQPVNILGLDWTTWYDETGNLTRIDHYCEYTLLEEGKVQREYWKTGESHDITTIGRYISNIEFSQDGSIVTVTITSSPEGRDETAEQMTYDFYVLLKEELVQ